MTITINMLYCMFFMVKHGTVYFYTQAAHEPVFLVAPSKQITGKLPLRDRVNRTFSKIW